MSADDAVPVDRAEVLLRALSKMPTYDGVSFRGWSRGNTFGPEGPAHVTRLLTATSRDVRIATENFTSDGLYAFVGRSGRRIERLSQHPEEQEVVFLPSTILKVITVARIAQLPFVLVEELDPSRTDTPPQRTVEEIATPIVAMVQQAWAADDVTITTPGKFIGDVE
jgi:hypothetical protein